MKREEIGVRNEGWLSASALADSLRPLRLCVKFSANRGERLPREDELAES